MNYLLTADMNYWAWAQYELFRMRNMKETIAAAEIRSLDVARDDKDDGGSGKIFRLGSGNVFLSEVKKQLIDRRDPSTALPSYRLLRMTFFNDVIALKWKKTRDQDVDLWSFYIQKKGERYAVLLKKGSPQEA